MDQLLSAKDQFIEAIHDRRKVAVRFFSKQDGRVLTRKCAPMDFGPSRLAEGRHFRFQLWNYEGDEGPRPLSLLPGQLRHIVVLEERFDPGEFVTWDTKAARWVLPRDWGTHS